MSGIYMVSLGCAKNMVDAEIMLGETLGDGFDLVLAPEEADVIIINTCGFIEDARAEARTVIGEYLTWKRQNPSVKVVAAGCWAERWPEELSEEFPDLDAIWGLDIPSSLREMIKDIDAHPGAVAGIGVPTAPREGARLLSTLPSYAYLRLSDGCDNRCHYCAIPLIRGGLRSRHPQAILEEARSLEEQGVREIVVISQDTTAYAMDLREPGLNLASLLRQLLVTVKTPRIRLLYAHPAHLDEEVIDMLLSEPRLCGYLDLPIQHIADNVLKSMGRGYDGERVRQILNRFSNKNFTLRTTLLLGFPGESESDFTEALELVKQGWFRHVGAFAYSPERDTPAAAMANQVSAEEAERRRNAVLEAQSEIAFTWLDSRIGGTEHVLVDFQPEPGWLAARSMSEAPDADGLIYIKNAKSVPGDSIEACIKARNGYDLIAESMLRGKRRRKR